MKNRSIEQIEQDIKNLEYLMKKDQEVMHLLEISEIMGKFIMYVLETSRDERTVKLAKNILHLE